MSEFAESRVRRAKTTAASTDGSFATRTNVENDFVLSDEVTDVPADDGPEPGTVYTFPAWQLDDAKARIDAANKRLTKAGIEERFEFEVTGRKTVTKDAVQVEYVTIELNHPEIAYGGYTFLAAVDREEGGLVTRVQPNSDLGGWRPEDMTCDHCGRAIERNHTYLIQAPDGSRVQVGSTCIEPYLGVKPTALWALGMDPFDDMEPEGDGFGRESFSAGHSSIPTTSVIGLALAVTKGGHEYRPASWDNSTKKMIQDALWPAPKEREWADQMWALAEQYEKDGTVEKVLDSVANLKADSDYAVNLQTYTAGENVSVRGLGVVASAVKVYAKDQEWTVKRKAEADAAGGVVPGFMAEKGAKVAGAKVTVVKAIDHSGTDPYTGRDVTRTQVIMRDEAGHEVVWWASSQQDVTAGDELILTSGSVKKHDQFRGVDQTVLTRVMFTTAAEQAATAALPAWERNLPESVRRNAAEMIAAFDGVTNEAELAAAISVANERWRIGKKHLDAAAKHLREQFARGPVTPDPQARENFLRNATRFREHLREVNYSVLPETIDRAVAEAARDHKAGTLPDDAYAQIMSEAIEQRARGEQIARERAEADERRKAEREAYEAAHPEEVAARRRREIEREREQAEWKAKQAVAKRERIAAMTPEEREWYERNQADVERLRAESDERNRIEIEERKRQAVIDAAEAKAAYEAFGG